MTTQEFSFEKALEELQTIVSTLEAGSVGLDQSLSLYGRGIELVRLCNQRLEEAGQRVDAIRMVDDVPTIEPFAEERI